MLGLFGLAASSALVIGGVAGAFWGPPRTLVAAGFFLSHMIENA